MSADLDREIDRAVRSMLDREPSPRLRARVLASIEARGRTRSVTWLAWAAVPATAAAIAVLLIVLAPLRTPERPAQVSVSAHDVQLPASGSAIVSRTPAIEQAPPHVHERIRPERRVVATVAATNDLVGASSIEALPAPSPLSVGTLPAPGTAVMPSIQPAPLRVAALDLPALEMPRDAARGVDR